MKNHYVPQFIIKKFSKAINVFNLNSGEIREDRPSHKVFFSKDIYDDDVEKSLNINLETEFSKLINDKLFLEGDIELTRSDLYLIKKYLLVSSIRAQDEEYLKNFLLSFKNNSTLFFDTNLHFKNCKLPYTEETNWDNRKLFNNCILAFSQCENIEDLCNNNLCTKEMVAFAAPFLLSYMSIWDAPSGSEFILSDNGMITEYEGIYQITDGLNISKKGYLLHQLVQDKKNAQGYGTLLNSNSVMYENYNIFNISKKRCIIMINPFFKQYFKFEVGLYDNHRNIVEKHTLPKPDIWPCIIQNISLFEPPKTQYKIMPTIPTMLDIFYYKPHILNDEELIYINSLLILQSREIIGFDNPNKVFSSLEFAINKKGWLNSIKENDKNITEEKVIFNYLDNVINDPLLKLLKWCQKKDIVVYRDDINILFQNLMDNIYKDMKSNPYIYEYLLSNEENTYNCELLDFFWKWK